MNAARLRRVLVIVTASVVAASASWWGFSARLAAAPNPVGEGLVTVVPYRVLDTRQPGSSPLDANAVRDVPIAGVGVVPANASGVIVNITAVNATAPGSYLTLFPTGAPRPDVSTLNPQVGGVVFNSATVRLGAGSLAIYNYTGRVDVIVDITGYIVPIAPNGGAGSRAYSISRYFVADPLFMTSTPTLYASITVPSGNYVVNAKATILGGTAGVPSFTATCELRAGSRTRDMSSIGSTNQQVTSVMPLMFAAAVTEGRIDLYCSAGVPFGTVALTGWQLIASTVDSIDIQGCTGILPCS